MSRVKIGLIGCGKQGPKHIRGYRNDPEVDLVLADLDHPRALALAEREGLVAASIDEIFADPDIVAVDICAPTHAHGALIRRALDAGKSFLCEKPLGATLGAAETIAREARERGVIGMVGFLYRFVPVFETGHTILRGVAETGSCDALGRVIAASFRIGGRGSHEVWKHRVETGGGVINEMLVHMLDLVLWYLGPVAEVRVHRRELLQPVRVIGGESVEVDAEDYVLMSLTTRSGVEVTVEADFVTPAFGQWVEIQGENGTYRGSITADAASFLYCIDEAGGWSAGKTRLESGDANFFVGEVREFLGALRARRPPTRCTVDEAVEVMRLVEHIRTTPTSS